MIVREKPGLLAIFLIFRQKDGSILPRIYPQLLVVMGLSALVVLGHRDFPYLVPVVSSAPFALIGIALSIFLGFRNNACYDRWWEGRKQWGALVAICRDFGRQTMLLNGRAQGQGAALRGELLNLTIGFTFALVQHLRPGGASDRIVERLAPADVNAFLASRNRPDFILRRMSESLARAQNQGLVSDIEFTLLDSTIRGMGGAQAACERLRTTQVPFAYTLLLHRTAYIFCFLLPFGFADLLGWLAPVAAGIVAYTFFGLDTLGNELEEPFGTWPNCLPIEALADIIAINLRESMGERDLPELPQPKNFILM